MLKVIEKNTVSISFLVVCALLVAWPVAAQKPDVPVDSPAGESLTPQQQAFMDALGKLNWIRGPATVDVVGNSKLVVPEGYAFLGKADTAKYLELNQNLSDGNDMMVAPTNLRWSAYLSFADEGYVKDDEKIDGAALLKTLQAGAEASNEERRKRGWQDLHVTGWAVAPAYNSTTKRLEWATDLQGASGRNVNFFTKILGRRGHTTVVLVTAPDELRGSISELNGVLGGYQFNAGDTYAEYKPGDRVAEYGLAALVLGGAAAIATKKGFWAVLATFFATTWKFILAGMVALGAWFKRLLGSKAS